MPQPKSFFQSLLAIATCVGRLAIRRRSVLTRFCGCLAWQLGSRSSINSSPLGTICAVAFALTFNRLYAASLADCLLLALLSSRIRVNDYILKKWGQLLGIYVLSRLSTVDLGFVLCIQNWITKVVYTLIYCRLLPISITPLVSNTQWHEACS